MPRLAPFTSARNWAATLPLPAYFGLVTVLYGVLSWVFNAVQHPRDATWADLLLRVVIGSLFGAAMTGVVAFQRRRFGGSALMSATANAIRSGEVPAGADPGAWTPAVQRRIRVLRRSRWLSPVLISPIVVFAVSVWILVPRTAVAAVWLIGVTLVVVAIAEVQAARYLPRAATVLDRLQSRGPGSVEPSPPSPEDAVRPRTVPAALVACAVAAAGVAFELGRFLLTPGGVADAARSASAGSSISLARAEQLATIAATILVTYWSVLLVALVVSGWWAFRGRNWARALLVPTTLLTLLELIGHKPISITVTVASIAAVVLLYLPASTAFFASRRTGRLRSTR